MAVQPYTAATSNNNNNNNNNKVGSINHVFVDANDISTPFPSHCPPTSNHQQAVKFTAAASTRTERSTSEIFLQHAGGVAYRMETVSGCSGVGNAGSDGHAMTAATMTWRGGPSQQPPGEMKMTTKSGGSSAQGGDRQRVVNCCKRVVAFLFSHVGLAGMVVAYSIAGGFLFQTLEAPYERQVKQEVLDCREAKIRDIVELRRDSTGVDDGNFTVRVREVFRLFQNCVVDAVKIDGWDGVDDTEEATMQWSFAGALLFAVTVITTIGMYSVLMTS